MSSLSSLFQSRNYTTIRHGSGGNGTFASVNLVIDPAEPFTSVAAANIERRANATFVLLARNSDLEGVVESIRGMEDRFNKNFNYPWVLLNEEPFTEEFKRFAV